LERERLAELHQQQELDRIKSKLTKYTKAARAREGLLSSDLKKTLYASPLRGGGKLVAQYYHNTATKKPNDKPDPFVNGEEQNRHNNKIK